MSLNLPFPNPHPINWNLLFRIINAFNFRPDWFWLLRHTNSSIASIKKTFLCRVQIQFVQRLVESSFLLLSSTPNLTEAPFSDGTIEQITLFATFIRGIKRKHLFRIATVTALNAYRRFETRLAISFQILLWEFVLLFCPIPRYAKLDIGELRSSPTCLLSLSVCVCVCLRENNRKIHLTLCLQTLPCWVWIGYFYLSNFILD